MLNYKSILSNYDDKLTLMEWLKKVEAALQDASATSFKVNKKGNATISFSIVFADGSEIESGDIVLQQGESVESAAIVDGDLILTLTNGDEINAGNIGAVSGFSIDANSHLIVSFQDGTTQDLGNIFNGNIDVSGNLTASTLTPAAYNYSANLNMGGGVVNIYSKLLVKGKTLEVIANFKYVNDTDDPISKWGISSAYITLPEAIAEKVIDYSGNSVHDVASPNFNIIAIAPCYYNSGVEAVSQSYKTDSVLVLMNMNAANQMGVSIQKTTNSQITIPAHTTYYFTARISLDIM